MPGFAGFRTDLRTWILMAGMTAFWLASVRLVPGWKRDGWPSLLRSLYGIVWLDFGLDIVLRFSMLAYNAVEWGNGGLRLVAQPVDPGQHDPDLLLDVLGAGCGGLRGRSASPWSGATGRCARAYS